MNLREILPPDKFLTHLYTDRVFGDLDRYCEVAGERFLAQEVQAIGKIYSTLVCLVSPLRVEWRHGMVLSTADP